MDAPLIFVIDDDEDLKQLLTELLRMRGYRSRFAANGREVQVALTGERPALAVLDWFIPDSSAESIARQLHERAIPFVLSSGATEICEHASGLGAAAFLAKPFTVDQLFAAIEEVLPSSRKPPPAYS